MSERDSRAFQDILAAIAGDTVDLARKEMALLKAETRATVRSFYLSLFLTAAGFVAAIIAAMFAGVALFEYLLVLTQQRAASALIVAVVMAVIAGIVLVSGYQRLASTSFIPRETLASLKRSSADLFGRQSHE